MPKNITRRPGKLPNYYHTHIKRFLLAASPEQLEAMMRQLMTIALKDWDSTGLGPSAIAQLQHNSIKAVETVWKILTASTVIFPEGGETELTVSPKDVDFEFMSALKSAYRQVKGLEKPEDVQETKDAEPEAVSNQS